MDGFERFWSVYPRRVGKQHALKAWKKIAPDAALVETMVSALAWQVEQPAWTKDDGLYIPHPTTWLNGHRWEDEPVRVVPRIRYNENTREGRTLAAAARVLADRLLTS